MDMTVTSGPLRRRLLSGRAFTAISHVFVMNVYSLWIDLALGFLIAGALAAWVPDAAWSTLFITGHGALSQVWGALVAPLVAVVSFVCSVGNIPLAAVLWRSGISFAGVITFIYADLIILPIVDIHRRYYGARTALYLFAASYAAMALAGLAAAGMFDVTGATPRAHRVPALTETFSWGPDAVLDSAVLAVGAVLLGRFMLTGGPGMLRQMTAAPAAGVEGHGDRH